MPTSLARTVRLAGLTSVVGVAAVISGCTGTPAPTAVIGPPPPFMLLVSRTGGGPAMEANVAGELAISQWGCVTVADYVLVAPPGSSVINEGVRLEGIGDVAIGQRISTSGGIVDLGQIPPDMRPEGYEVCHADEVAVISAP